MDGAHADHVEALRVAGYAVEIAPTALEALERGDSLRPDALIVPLALPDMEGVHLADRIGSAKSRVHTLAIVILIPDGAGRRHTWLRPSRAARARTRRRAWCFSDLKSGT